VTAIDRRIDDQKPKIYLIVGVPGSGKSWICERLGNDFKYVHHDGFIGHIKHPEKYVQAILEATKSANKPIIAEAPFSISKIMGPLVKAGKDVEPVFIIVDKKILSKRYQIREGHDIPQGHLTRMDTYAQRAKERGAFSGTSDEVLKYLKGKV